MSGGGGRLKLPPGVPEERTETTSPLEFPAVSTPGFATPGRKLREEQCEADRLALEIGDQRLEAPLRPETMASRIRLGGND